jgi:hypothetical protein
MLLDGTSENRIEKKHPSRIDTKREVELITAFQKTEDPLAFQELLRMREPMLRANARDNAYLDSGDEENLFSELQSVWLKSIEHYHFRKGIPFGTYLSSNLKKKLADLDRGRHRQKRTDQYGDPVKVESLSTKDDLHEADPWSALLASSDADRVIKLIAGRDNVIRKALERLRTGECSKLRDACQWKSMKLRIGRREWRIWWKGNRRKVLQCAKWLVQKSGKCRRGFKLYGSVRCTARYMEVEVLDNSDKIYQRVLAARERARPAIERELKQSEKTLMDRQI